MRVRIGGKASLPAAGHGPPRRGQAPFWLHKAEGRWAAALRPVPAAGAQLPSSNGSRSRSEGASPGPGLRSLSTLGRVRRDYVVFLPKTPQTLSLTHISCPSGKAGPSLPKCLGKRGEEGVRWGEASRPLCLPSASLQQGYNLCFKVAPRGAPVWQADW